MNNGLQSECFEYPTTGDRCEICNSLSHTANRCNHKSINKHKDALWESMVQPDPPDFSAMPKEHLAYLQRNSYTLKPTTASLWAEN